MNLTDSLIIEDTPQRMVFVTGPSSTRLALGVILGAVGLWFIYSAMRARTGDDVVWRWLGMLLDVAPAAIFLIVAIGIGFGRERLTIDTASRSALHEFRLGPFKWSKKEALPVAGVVRVEFESKRSGSTEYSTSSRHYTVKVRDLELIDLHIVDDREPALKIAARIANLLGYDIENLAEDDGVQRIRANGPKPHRR
jgi:hypothetical protein